MVESHARFQEVPLCAVRPEGWLRQYLDYQRTGLTGHMEVAGFPFNTGGWACAKIPTKGIGWWPYEQTGYWIDGMIRCGHLLRDAALIEKARKHVRYVLSHQSRDGYLGPKHIKKSVPPQQVDRRVHAVFFRALQAEHSATGDDRIFGAVAEHYLSGTSRHFHDREVCNVESILWAYGRTGDRRLLAHACEAWEAFNRDAPNHDCSLKNLLSRRRAREHGVTYNEMAKLPALLHAWTGDRALLRATVNAYRKIDRDQMLVDGVCSSSEHLRGKDPLDSHETCDIADYTWSVGYLLAITGKAEYADKIERACFNAAPGAVTNDFRALQYFSCPNQIVSAHNSNHNRYTCGGTWMSYRPNPGTACCPGEVHRTLPNYVARMFLSDGEGGVAAAMYGPARFTSELGPARRAVTIVEDTAYPFSERIEFQIRTEDGRPVRFRFTLRIPAWCAEPRILFNGKPLARRLRGGTFVTLDRTFDHNDRVTLHLPMKLKLSRWPGGGIAVERGPILYSLPIPEDWRPVRDKNSSPEFPAWDILPAGDWNYALDLDEANLADRVEVVHNGDAGYPWDLDRPPIELRVPARKVRGWKMVKTRRAMREAWWKDPDGWHYDTRPIRGDFRFTPPLPEEASLPGRLGRRIETVALVPYGCTQLRMTILPQCPNS